MTLPRPPITIAMTTYFPPGEIGARRKAEAQRTVETWDEYLHYDGLLYVHVGDDGSAPEHEGPLNLGWADDVTTSRQERHGVGASLNAGCRQAFTQPDGLALYAVDDWTLTADLDLTRWAELIEALDIGALRLGPPHPDLTGTVRHWDNWGQLDHPGIWWLDLDRHHFAFGHRPALYHPRLFDAYGWFAEDVNAYDCERLYSLVFNARAGPSVGLALGHPWIPIAQEKELELAHIDPRDG
ncbi:hypothetical protein LCGC14_2325690 [marine sediment metagenome]|uniref:Glycosyltransferase 2-like domain-containing protein n=1 Tax=marine sediment metagenome TaxID=412755 RepID=A0A0F9ETX7_9ZZZZ